MTTKDIRDIAAYWGAPVKYEHTVLGKRVGAINWSTMMSVQGNFVEDLKLQLRSLNSLSNQEILTITKLSGLTPNPALNNQDLHLEGYEIVWLKYEGHICVVGKGDRLYIMFNGCIRFQYANCIPGPIIAYLQSIHVYVPGTVEEKYVELV